MGSGLRSGTRVVRGAGVVVCFWFVCGSVPVTPRRGENGVWVAVWDPCGAGSRRGGLFLVGPRVCSGDALVAWEGGVGCPPTSVSSLGRVSPWASLTLGPRPWRVTHCCFEHAGQNFGSRPRPPGIPPLLCVDG